MNINNSYNPTFSDIGRSCGNPTNDLFSRQRVTTATTIFECHSSFDISSYRMEQKTVNNATIIHNAANATYELSISGSAGSRAFRQSHEYILYQPGKTQIVYTTFVPSLEGNLSGCVARIGLFDDYRDKTVEPTTPPILSMGHYIEISGNEWSVVEHSNSRDNSENVVRVKQSQWNIDTLNGQRETSPSGMILGKISETHLLVIEKQWLGVGVTRMGFIINGHLVYVHAFYQRPYQFPYHRLNKLPLRWEIEALATTSKRTLAAICGTVQVEGNYIPMGSLYSMPPLYSKNAIALAEKTATFPTVLCALRLQAKHCRATIKLTEFDVVVQGTSNAERYVTFSVLWNPTITLSNGAAWINHPTSTSMSQIIYNNAAGTDISLSNTGTVITTKFSQQVSNIQVNISEYLFPSIPPITSSITGQPDIIVLVAQMAGTGTVNVNGALSWMEIT